MKLLLVVLSAMISISCHNEVKEDVLQQPDTTPKDIIRNELQILFDSLNVTGSILVFDAAKNEYYSNDFIRCDKGFLPASTFKIPNSIIALESGVVEDDSTLFKWNGEKRRLPVWEKDLIFREAFHVSCVPCYQEIARKVGLNRMKKYLEQFEYGNMIVDSSSLDIFWLEGNSKISQRQQITFLEKFYNSEIGISRRTEDIMKRLMIIEENNDYILSGKTGWAIRNENNIGWFVGFIETNGKVYYFATNIEPEDSFDMDKFGFVRREISQKAFSILGIIK